MPRVPMRAADQSTHQHPNGSRYIDGCLRTTVLWRSAIADEADPLNHADASQARSGMSCPYVALMTGERIIRKPVGLQSLEIEPSRQRAKHLRSDRRGFGSSVQMRWSDAHHQLLRGRLRPSNRFVPSRAVLPAPRNPARRTVAESRLVRISSSLSSSRSRPTNRSCARGSRKPSWSWARNSSTSVMGQVFHDRVTVSASSSACSSNSVSCNRIGTSGRVGSSFEWGIPLRGEVWQGNRLNAGGWQLVGNCLPVRHFGL